MLFSWIVDQIPLWVYLIVAGTAIGLCFYFFSPILIPLWEVTPRPIKWLLGGLAAIFGAYVLGRNKGNKDAKAIEKQREVQAVETRSKIDENVNSRSDTDLDKSADKWMRD